MQHHDAPRDAIAQIAFWCKRRVMPASSVLQLSPTSYRGYDVTAQ